MKSFKALTPALRHRQIVPSIPHDAFKPLVVGRSSPGFRNNTGRITVRHRGGGHKRNLRIVDSAFVNSLNSPFQVIRLDYDPSRSGLLALCKSLHPAPSGIELRAPKASVRINAFKYFYMLASDRLTPGLIVSPSSSSSSANLPLHSITIGSVIHNIEAVPGQGGCYAKAAGTSATLVNISTNSAQVLLPSKQLIVLDPHCKASLGLVSNKEHSLTVLGKAGASR